MMFREKNNKNILITGHEEKVTGDYNYIFFNTISTVK